MRNAEKKWVNVSRKELATFVEHFGHFSNKRFFLKQASMSRMKKVMVERSEMLDLFDRIPAVMPKSVKSSLDILKAQVI